MTNIGRHALTAIEQFLKTFARDGTRNQRRTYLEEYVAYLTASTKLTADQLTTGDLLNSRNIHDWMTAAQNGATRRRRGTQGPHSAAAPNSMAARITTLNTFSRFCGKPLQLPRPRTASPLHRLTPVEAHRTLRLLAGHQPAGMRENVWYRSVAIVAVAVCTRRGLTDLHAMRLRDVELDRALPRVRVAGQWYPLDVLSCGVLARWLARHRELTMRHPGDRGSHSLWVTTRPRRRRSSGEMPEAGLPARLRTLEAANRKLMTRALGSPLRLEQFCAADRDPGGPGGVEPRSTGTWSVDRGTRLPSRHGQQSPIEPPYGPGRGVSQEAGASTIVSPPRPPAATRVGRLPQGQGNQRPLACQRWHPPPPT